MVEVFRPVLITRTVSRNSAHQPQGPIKLADFGLAHRQRMNEGLSADDIGRCYSATLSPELVNRCGDEEGGLDGHASDAWALGAVLCMLLARDATLSFSNLTTDLDRGPASSTAPATAIASVGERQRRLYQLIFPANAVPSNLRRESRFAPLIELAEHLLRRLPAERPPPNKVVDVLEASDGLLTSLDRRGALGWRVTARHLSPSDDVREACAACRSTPWPLRWCIRSQLYWANVLLNTEAAWRREAHIARGVVLAWAVGVWAFVVSHVDPHSAKDLCITFLLAIYTPGYCVWFYLVYPHRERYPSTFFFWTAHLTVLGLTSLNGAIQTQAAGFYLCAVLGVALCPLWQAVVTCLPAECRLPAVLGPSSTSAETVTSAAQATDSQRSWSWGRSSRPRSKLDYSTEAALRAELAILQELARVGGAPPACTLTARDACDGVGMFRLSLAVDVEPLAALVARPGAYTKWEAWVWLHEAAGALAYLHDRGMHHGNINLESVLTTSTSHGRQVRLCRFGQAPDISTAFASPEKADSVAEGGWGAHYDAAAADVWSLGVLVVTLLSRRPEPPPDELRRLGGAATAEDEVLACRLREVAELCGLRREDDFYSTPEWEKRSRFQPFIKLAEWALRVLPSQRPSAADAERMLFTSSVFVWRTHGAGLFRLPGLRGRWRDDLIDLLSPSATGLVLRQAVKVQVFWAVTLSAEPQHAHLRRVFDRVVLRLSNALLATPLVTLLFRLGDVVEASRPTLLGFYWASLPLVLAVPDADQAWLCASPRLPRTASWTSRTTNDLSRFETKYIIIFLIRVLAGAAGFFPLPKWLWPALGAVVVGKVLVVVGCALLWVYTAGYMGRPQQRGVQAVDEGQPAGVELEERGLVPLVKNDEVL
jgi:serine/threonine protein kinase